MNKNNTIPMGIAVDQANSEESKTNAKFMESLQTIVEEDQKYDAKFINRFSNKEKIEMDFTSPVLLTWEIENGRFAENECSASPGDYYFLQKDSIFSRSCLKCEASFEGIHKRILLKEQPTVEDLRNWYRLAKDLVVYRTWAAVDTSHNEENLEA